MSPARSAPCSKRTPTTARPKTTLFCPECGHESDLEGDWIRGDDGRPFACPSCGAIIERHPPADRG